jgi:predicted CoA-binding protein
MAKTKKTVIIGATTNPSRYAYIAAGMLTEYNHEIIPVGIKKGEVYGKSILDINQRPPVSQVDTVTLYIGPQHQPEHFDYILSLKPKRVIFNPGTENPEFEKMIENTGAEALEACTLVLLRSGQY